MSYPMVPHFQFPFSILGGHVQVTEQDTQDEIDDCVLVLLLTPVNSREVLPGYGTPETLFAQQPLPIAQILSQVRQWESRASVLMNVSIDELNEKITYLMTKIAIPPQRVKS